MMTMISRIRRLMSPLLVMMAVLLIVAGCDSADPAADGEGVRTVLRFEAAAPAGKTAGPVTVEEAKLLIRAVKFHPVDEDEEEQEFVTGPFAVTLDLDGTPNPVAVQSVPPDTYKRVTFDIHKPEDDETPPDPEFKDGTSGQERYSVIVRGTVEGEPFELKVRESIKQRVALVPPLVIDGTTSEVTVTLQADIAQWFVDDEGRLLDPRIEDDADEVADQIKESFRALSTK